jgi:hypothetical protein
VSEEAEMEEFAETGISFKVAVPAPFERGKVTILPDKWIQVVATLPRSEMIYGEARSHARRVYFDEGELAVSALLFHLMSFPSNLPPWPPGARIEGAR